MVLFSSANAGYFFVRPNQRSKSGNIKEANWKLAQTGGVVVPFNCDGLSDFIG